MGRDQGPARAGHRHDLVVIGASAGGVEALTRVVAGLPSDLPATVCIVMHIAPDSPSLLGAILARAGALPCRAPADGDQLRAGEMLVGAPDRHLAIRDGHVALTLEPPVKGHRPSVDVLFRSAAAASGERVLGVVLSGNQDDGTAGLQAIKAEGGAAIVQDPDEAMYAGMPAHALARTPVDAVVSSARMAAAITAIVTGSELLLSAGASGSRG